MKRELKKWCDANSKPRRNFYPPKVSRGKKARLSKLLPRIVSMSQPGARYLVKPETLEEMYNYLMVKKSSLKYKATARIKKLAEPQMRGDYIPQLTQSVAFMVPPKALKYKTSPRTEEMAKVPKNKVYKKVVDTSFEVKRGALSYSPSPRIGVLATPVNHPVPPPKEPGKVNKSALSAAASPRTLEMSEPRARLDNNSREPVISKAALSYVATERINKLSTPTHVTPKFRADPPYQFRH